MTNQMVDVTRPWNSIARICDNHNFVVCHRDGGWVEHEWTGPRAHFSRERGVYTMSAWVQAPVLFFRGRERGAEFPVSPLEHYAERDGVAD